MEPKLFKASLNTAAEEFKQYLPVNVNLRYETVASYLVLTENNYIKPLLGTTLFNRLVTWYEANANDTGTSLDKQLLDLVRFAEIRLALWKGFDSIQAMISDTGIATNVEKDNRLYRYQEENIKSNFKNEGFDQLDSVLIFLEDNISDFPQFETSKYYTELNNSLIHNTAEFNECFNIDNSRLVFLKMKPFIRDVELIKLQHRIGSAFYNELLTADNTLDKYARILPAIRFSVVYGAVADGIGELHKLPTEKGLVFESNFADNVEVKPIEAEQLKETQIQFARKAESYLDSAIHIINENKADYPLYTAFAGNSPADGVIHIDNTNHKTFLA